MIFGSFVTNKELPGDVDIVLVMAEAFKLEDAPRESRTLFAHAEADARSPGEYVLITLRQMPLTAEGVYRFLRRPPGHS